MYSLVYGVCDVCWGLPPHSLTRLSLRSVSSSVLRMAPCTQLQCWFLLPHGCIRPWRRSVFGLCLCERVRVCVCVLPGEMHSHRGDNLVHYVLWFAAVASGLWHRMLCHLLPTGFLMRVCDLDASSLTTVSFPLFTSVFSILITLFIALAWRNLLGWGGGMRTVEFLAIKVAWGWGWVCGIVKVQPLHVGVHVANLRGILENTFK